MDPNSPIGSQVLGSSDLHQLFCWHRSECPHCMAGSLPGVRGDTFSFLQLYSIHLQPWGGYSAGQSAYMFEHKLGLDCDMFNPSAHIITRTQLPNTQRDPSINKNTIKIYLVISPGYASDMSDICMPPSTNPLVPV